jgi:signal transduction histidine kinase
MKNRPIYTEPVSVALRRHPHGDKTELTEVMRWVALVSLFVLLVLTLAFLITGFIVNALISAVTIFPVLVVLLRVKQESVSVPSTILAITLITYITMQALLSEGIYDIGVLGYPVVMIVTGLILRGRVFTYLTFYSIFCLGLLALGTRLNWSAPSVGAFSVEQDFLIGSVILLIAGNSISRLTNIVYDALQRAEQEIESRTRMESQREALIHQLRSKNQELDRFAIRVSHDLKSPLITLAGFLGLLEKDIKDGNNERIEKDLSQINEAAKSMGKFVDELLDLSRIGRIINPPKDVAFDEVLQDALKVTDGLLKQKQVQVEIDAIFPFVHVDRVRVVQVLQNLIANAVKFMGDQQHPIIKISFEEIDGEHIFSVQDNGIGIAPEYHEGIFELFSKLNPEIEGTGIGLGLVKRIVEVHHGRVWVESEVGAGSTFRFTLSNSPKRNG